MRRQRAVSAALILAGLTLTACDATPPRGPGSILVSSARVNAEPTVMPLYEIRVDGGSATPASFFENLSFMVNGLAHGDHVVSLDGLASSCTAANNPRTVRVSGDDTALVVFSISCQRTTGDIRVNVTTTGTDPDVSYSVTLNGMTGPSVGANGTMTLQYMPAGTYSIGLSGVASNCSAGAAQSVTVTPGNTATVNITVACAAAAVIRFVASTTGPDKDADGLLLGIDQANARVGIGTTNVRVTAGTRNWALSDVQPNCTLDGPASGSATIAQGDTVTINAALTCTSIGYGVAGTVATDPAGDTLANMGNNVNPGFDILQLTTRYAPNWLILVARFNRPVSGVGGSSLAALFGAIDLDVDESIATGVPPYASGFGGSSQQGSDYMLSLFEANTNGIRVRRNGLGLGGGDSTEHRVPFAIEGDSLVIRIPLAKLGGDDGNLTISTILGTFDRPTDIAPNSGLIVARPAGSPVIAASLQGAEGSQKAPVSIRRQPAAWPPRY